VLRHKRPAALSIGVDLDERVVRGWRLAGLVGCEFVRADATGFLRSYPFQGEELVYADPPYLPETRLKKKVYRHEYTRDQHVELLDVLAGLNASVLVSGYASALYDDRLRGWRRVDFKGDSHIGPRVESVWLNYDPSPELHDYSYIGDSFRERERIRRKQARLAGRVAALPEEERRAFFSALARSHPDALKIALEGAP